MVVIQESALDTLRKMRTRFATTPSTILLSSGHTSSAAPALSAADATAS